MNIEEYEDWTPPEHEHTFIDNTTVKAAVRGEDGVFRYWLVKVCTQCDETVTEPTDEIAQSIR